MFFYTTHVCAYVQDYLQGDASKAKSLLGWESRTSFKVCDLYIFNICNKVDTELQDMAPGCAKILKEKELYIP